MLAAMPGVPPQAQQRGAANVNVNVTSSPVLEDDRLCAGCNKSVSSDTGGVVVAFGNSLWHVDCFKCAKCGNQVNADTNLLLLSDGSPVCANCYNCKICKLPILDEAVMTGDDSFHAECFRCRSCKNRIDELVFAKTSQGFYCMKCHNERVARSRRHIAKQKQREREREKERERDRERERAALGSSSGGRSANANTTAENGVMPRPKEGESVNAVPARPDSARTNDAPGGSSNDGQAQTSSQSQAMGSRGSYPSTSGGDAGTLGPGKGDAGLRSTSPAPPAVSVTEAGPSSEQQGGTEEHHLDSRQRANSHSQDNHHHHQINGISSDRRPSVDGHGLPPYAKSSPPVSGNSDVESARSSASFGYNASSTEPTSPSLSVSVSQEGASSSDQNHCAPANDEGGSTTLAYLESTESGRDRSNSLTPRERPGDASGSGWPGVLEQEGRRKSHDDTRPSYLQPAVGGTSSLQVTKKREKRRSVNPGLQLEASKMLQYHNLQHPGTSPLGSPAKSPASPTGSSPASAPAGTFGRTHSPTTVPGGRESPRVTSPLREYFTNSEDNDKELGSTAFYPPSPPPQQLRTLHSSTPRSAPVGARPSTAPTSTPGFGRFPQRSDSLQGTDSPSSSGSGHTRSHSRANGLPSSPYNGRLNASTQLRSQRSFDERGGHLSPRNAEFGGEASGAKRSRSVSPHPPDVPRSIESGTDTETDNGNDSDSIMQSYLDRSDSTAQTHYPPAPPPKDPRTEIVATPPAVDARGRSGSQPTSQPSSAGAADGDEYFADKVEEEDVLQTNSAVTQRTSGFFIAPALPPMRFSMSGTDFNELLNNLGGSASAKRLSMIPGARAGQVDGSGGNGNNKDGTIPEERSEELDLDVATVRTPTSLASTITPLPTDMTPSTSDNVASSATANSNVNASGSGSGSGPTIIKPAERKASLRRKAPPPFEIAMYPSNEPIAEASSSSATSPISPNNYNYEERVRSPRRSSKTDVSKVFVDEVTTGSPRSSAESRRPTTPKMYVNGVNGHGHRRSESTSKKQDAAELVNRRLKEALADATERQADYIKLDRAFVEAIVQSLDQKREQVTEISTKLDSMKRTSQMIFDGLSVAQDEYKQQLAARQTAEEEVSRLKIEVSGQAARITALSSDERRRQVQKQLEKELNDSLSGLEQNLSKLKVERDMTLAEVEELSASKNSVPNGDGQGQGASIGRSLTMRLDNIKRQYQHDLVPLTQQREVLVREIVDLKEARDIFLEETAVLNARNEELAQLNQQYERRVESGHSREKSLPPVQQAAGQSKTSIDKFDSWKARQGLGQGAAAAAGAAAQASPMVNTTSTSSSATLIEDVEQVRQQRPAKSEVGDIPAVRNRIGLRWPGGKANKDVSALGGGLPAAMDNGNSGNGKVKKRIEHAFQQLSVLRFARCDLCGDKMWGSQVRCSTCNMSVHVRCVGQVQASCHDGSANGSDEHLAPVGPPPPSMFGRDLIEQVREDAKNAKNADLFVPIIVEKCINAVEANAMDYEGIYRKTGGSGQSKAITALFERGDYESFNLSDSDSFNDVSSVTSVLKNYFRMLPNPLLTFGMHEAFVAAGGIKDLQAKGQALRDLVKQLPAEHYHTLSRLMSHLHRIQLNAEVNLMNARNLGVIFGPTLMRSADPSREFADMAGKSLAIEYLIENAPSIFPSVSGSSGLTS